MINKELIKQRFSKNLSQYDTNATIQLEMAEKLYAKLESNHKYADVLEIGCGTGFLTKLVSENNSYSSYTAIDIVSECEGFIKKINPEIDFVSEDIESFINKSTKKYDLIISNACFQWIENLETFFNNLINLLNPNGILLFSTFGKENFSEINQILGKTLKYYSTEELRAVFKDYNAEIEEEVRILSFEAPIDVLKHLKYTGVNALEVTTWTKNNLVNFKTEYNKLYPEKVILTYNPIYVKLINY